MNILYFFASLSLIAFGIYVCRFGWGLFDEEKPKKKLFKDHTKEVK